VSSWKGKTRGGIAGYKIFIGILKYLGLPFAYFLLRFVALYFFLFTPASFKNSFYFYHRRLGWGVFRSVISIYRNYYLFGQVILDKFVTLGGFSARFDFTFDGENHLRKMVSDRSGGLLISAHVGNFEMAGHMLERLDTKVNIIMLDAEHRRIRQYISTFTYKSFHIIPIREDNAHVYEISEALKNREIICLHGDRYMPGSKTLTFKFLGEKTSFPTGPFYLAMKYGVPVSFVFAMKEDDRHYHFFATKPKYYTWQESPAKRDGILKQIIADYVAALEEKVRQFPLQWFNYYDFWKS
jgi:predicted LPLAT superfamily acyltransferase